MVMSLQGYDFDKCNKLFLEQLRRQEYSKETIDGYRKDLENFRCFMRTVISKEDFSVDLINKRVLLDFMDAGRVRGNKASTIGRRLSTLKSFYKFLVYELDYPVDEAARIRTPKVYVPLKDILSAAEVQRLLQSAKQLPPCYSLLFNALYYTGSRLTPIRMLEKQHVHLKEKLIYLSEVKGGKDHYLPLHPHLKDLFESYFTEHLSTTSNYVFPSNRIPSQPLSASDIRNKLRYAARLADLSETITPHTLRHCTATHLTIQNVPQTKIATILGHADLRSTMRYQHLAVEHLRDSLDLL